MLAHALTADVALPVSPAFVAVVAVCVVAGAARVAATASTSAGVRVTLVSAARPPLTLTTVVAAVTLIALIVVSRIGWPGPAAQLHALAAPIIVCRGLWPLLVAVSVAAGNVWRWVDPWDGLGRLVTARDQTVHPLSDVRPAAVAGFAVVWYAFAFPRAFDPAVFGLALALYTLVMLAGCLVAGRWWWLSSAEVFGVFLGWVSSLRRGDLLRWTPPHGAAAVVGVLTGGAVSGELRTSTLWPVLDLPGVVVLGACCAAFAVAIALADVVAARGRAPSSATAAAVATGLYPCQVTGFGHFVGARRKNRVCGLTPGRAHFLIGAGARHGTTAAVPPRGCSRLAGHC